MLRSTVPLPAFMCLPRPAGRRRSGFTLIELLVVIGIIALLVSILLPVLGKVRRQAQVTACMSNLRETGKALQLYANDHNGTIPLLHPETRFWPGSPDLRWEMNYVAHNFIWLGKSNWYNEMYIGSGLLVERGYLSTARVLYCPADEILWSPESEIAKLGTDPPIDPSARSSYVYRGLFEVSGRKVHDLGQNRIGQKARMLMSDPMINGPGSQFHHQAHGGRSVNVLYIGGHVKTVPNRSGMLEIRLPLPGYPEDLSSFWERAGEVIRIVDWYDETGIAANPPVVAW